MVTNICFRIIALCEFSGSVNRDGLCTENTNDYFMMTRLVKMIRNTLIRITLFLFLIGLKLVARAVFQEFDSKQLV